VCWFPDRITDGYAIETLGKVERELLSCVEEQDVVAYLKKSVEYKASDPRQEVKAGA
jgi:hypothetical protein